jgi:Conserved TM helix
MTVLAVSFQDGIAGAWNDIAALAVRLAAAALVLLLGLLVAKVLTRATGKTLERTGFNRAVDRGGVRRFLAHSRYEPAQVLAKLVYWVVVLCALQLALGVFGPNPVSDLLSGVVGYLPRAFVAIVVLVAAVALGRFVRDILRGVLRLTPFGHQLAAAAGIAIVAAGCFIALEQLAIAPAIVTGLWYAALAALVGSAVVAFGVGGIPVARRYIERAANDLDGRIAKLNEVKAAERAAARASRAQEAHTATAAVEPAGDHGHAQPGVGYPVEPVPTGYADRPAAPYGGGDNRHLDPAKYANAQPAAPYPGPPGSGAPREPSPPAERGGYERPPSRPDDRTVPDMTRPYSDPAPARGGYAPDRPGGGPGGGSGGGSGPRPPGEQRRGGTPPPGGGGPQGGRGELPRGIPRPFDDLPSRYARSERRSDSDDEHRDGNRDGNGFSGDTYPYPR